MNRILRRTKQKEGGSAAVELAVLLTLILMPLLAGALFFGRFFWHYTVAEKAAQDAARFLASASPVEMKTQSPAGGPYIAGAARALALAEIAELNPGSTIPEVWVNCGGGPCVAVKNSALPQTVSVYVTMTIEDPFLSGLSSFLNNDSLSSIQIHATGNAYYVGN